MKLEGLDHPKTLAFASMLGTSRPAAIGHLELLWAYCATKTPQGNVGKWHDGSLAEACYWTGPPEKFVEALVAAGYLDRHPEHRLVVHDWHEHAPVWVRAKLQKLGLLFLSTRERTRERTVEGSIERSIEGSGEPTTGRSSRARVSKPSQNQAKPSQAKPRALRSGAPPSAPLGDSVDGLDAKAWETWIDYRTKIRKPLKPVSIPAAQQQLAAFGSEQLAVVKQSIANGWQGLFGLKTNGSTSGNGSSETGHKHKTVEENENEYIERFIREGRSDAEILALDDLACAPDLAARVRAIRQEIEHAKQH